MSRPVDWWVLDLEGDPTPGSPAAIRRMARSWSGLADDAEYAETRIRQLMGDEALGSWVGEAGDAFRSRTGDLPEQLGRCKSSYRRASEALGWWADRLDVHQGDADAALVRGRAARDEVEAARARASAAAAAVAGAANVGVLRDPSLEPTPEQVRDARARLSSARAASSSADAAVDAAQARLDQARALALDAKSLRESDGRSAASRIREASDAGIPERSRWEKFKDWAGEAWDVIVTIAKVVVAVLGIVALIIGGPLAWVVFAAALVLLADAIMKYMNGEGSLWDVAWAALGAIPGTKGLTTLAALRNAFRTGGALGATALVGRSATTMGRQMLTSANLLRKGLVPGTRAAINVLGEGTAFATPALRTTLRDMRTAFHEARMATASAADGARLWQGTAPYVGIDRYRTTTLAPGTRLEAGAPGLGKYSMPTGTAAGVGNDAPRLWESVQVGPGAEGTKHAGYRPTLVELHVNAPVDAATGVTRANPQFGDGGATQFFFDVRTQISAGNVSVLDQAGNPIDIPVGTPPGRIEGIASELPEVPNGYLHVLRGAGYTYAGSGRP
jgi:hypothetical protein